MKKIKITALILAIVALGSMLASCAGNAGSSEEKTSAGSGSIGTTSKPQGSLASDKEAEKFAFTLNDDGASYRIEGFSFEFQNDHFDDFAEVTKSIVIPASYKGKPVTEIYGDAFRNLDQLTSVTIPNSVTTIGTQAFWGCENLTEVIIPNSVTSMGEDVFGWCFGLERVTLSENLTSISPYLFNSCTALKSVIIPKSVTLIEHEAFVNCTSLEKLTIPGSVTEIDYDAFYQCTGLTDVIISEGVVSIGSGAFRECESLTSISLPRSVKSLGKMMLDDCESLPGIRYAGTTEEWESVEKNWSWKDLSSTFPVYCSDGDITK